MIKILTKKFLAVTVALLIMLCSVFSAGILSVFADTALFSDDFSNDSLKGWGATDVGSIKSGKYYLNGKESNSIASLGQRSNVIIGADVTVNIGADSSGNIQNSMATIVVGGDKKLQKGYEFSIGVTKLGTTYVRLYLRGDSDTSRILSQKTSDIPGVTDGTITTGRSYKLSLGYYDGVIQGFVNGKLAVSFKDSTFKTGYCGIKTTWSKSVFDNVEVRSIEAKKVSSISLKNTPSQVSVMGELKFDVDVTYAGSFHQPETLSSNNPAVSIKGFERKKGTKNVTVSYGGKSAAFTVKVVGESGDKLIYSDDFKAVRDNDYSYYKTEKPDFNVTYQFKTEGGALKATIPTLPIGFDNALIARNTLSADITEGLSSYYASADATIYRVAETPTKRNATAEISAFIDGDGKVYYYRVSSTGTAELYQDSTRLYSKTLSPAIGVEFELGKTFNMEICVSENILICRYNGVDIFNYTEANMKNSTTKVRLGAFNGDVTFDNLKVYSLEKYASETVKSIVVMSTSSGEMITSYTGKVLDAKKLYLKVTYTNGSVRTIGITDDMIKGYDSKQKKNQNVVINYGKASVKLPFYYSEYLFYDNFEGGKSPLWNFTSSPTVSNKVANGTLKTAWNGNSESASFYGAVQGLENYSNYSISMDFAFDQDMSKYINSGSFYSLVLRRTGNTYYDLRISCRAGSMSLQLYMYSDGKSAAVLNFTNTKLKNMVGKEKLYSSGEKCNLKAICKDDTVYIYLDEVLIGTYTNATEAAPKVGTAGIKVSKASGTIDNIIVEEKGASKIVDIAVAGISDNVFEVYEGFDVESYNYNLNCYDADGTVLVESLLPEMLSDYDNLEVGVQNITITAYGLSKPAKVWVKQRDDVIKDIDDRLSAVNVDSLTLSDAERIDEILSLYDGLSVYEVTKISDKSNLNAEKARRAIELLRYPELTKYELIYSNYFNSEQDCDHDDWSSPFATSRGEWSFINSTYRLEQKRYGISYNSLRSPIDVYGEIKSVSARIMLQSSNMYAGVGLNLCRDGHYIARVKMDSYDDYGNVIPMFQVLKDDVRVFSGAISGYGVTIEENTWFNIRMTFIDGIVSAYYNDVLIYSFDDSDSIDIRTEGYAGVYMNNGNGKFDNLEVRGVALDYNTTVAVPTPTIYSDDFEDEKSGVSPSHWVEVNKTDDWKTASSGDDISYGTTVTDGFTKTWLHVFEKDPTVNVDFKYSGAKSGATFGFFIRMAPETAYVRVGYDVKSKKIYVYETEAENDSDINITYSDKTYSLKENEWYKLKIVASGRELTVELDGETVFDKLRVTQIGYGRIGAYSDGSAFWFDNLKCDFPNGDVVQDGVLEYNMTDDIYGGALDSEVLSDTDIISFGSGVSFYSTDGGESFEVLGGNSAPEQLENYANRELIEKHGYRSSLKLHDGSHLFIAQSDMLVRKSQDNCKSWKTISRLFEEDELKDDLNRRLYIFHNNSLTEFQLEDGTWRIFMPIGVTTYNSQLTYSSSGHYTIVLYSDDGGVTWQRSVNDTRDITINYTEGNTALEWGESKIVKCSDGSFRMYLSRAKYGCVQYTVSRDGGVTWEGQYQIPEMQTAQASFNIIQDPNNLGTYYMVWVNNTPVRYGATFSRTRLSLARSYDGMNWEFLCDAERMSEEIYGNDMANTTPLMQIVDPGITVDDDYVYITCARSDGTDPTKITGSGTNYHNRLRARMVRIEKDKLKARAWDATSVSDMGFAKTIKVTEPVKTRYGVGELFSHGGGTFELERLDGVVEKVDTRRLYLYKEPDMFALGKHTVVLYNTNGMQASYEIEVVNKYAVTWDVKGKGKVEPQPMSVLEGDDLVVKVSPDSFCKAIVIVNGEKVKLEKGNLIIKGVKEALEIKVEFVGKGIVDYLLYIILAIVALIVVAAAVVLTIVIKKRKSIKPSVDKKEE